MILYQQEVQLSRRRLTNLIRKATQELPVHEAFLSDLRLAIEQVNSRGRRTPSKTYKPSSFVCLRQMYFMRVGQPTDPSKTDYQSVGMADTGSRRHEAIQDVLLQMKELGFDWEYVDVGKYIEEQQAKGNCRDIKVVSKVGAETKLFHTTLHLSFMCDGIIRRISTDEHFLFEFKNQISFKTNFKKDIDAEHKIQVACYCLALNLSEVFVVYENRDLCSLEAPTMFTVTEEMKKECVDKILSCESYVDRLIPPPAHEDSKPCKWCSYQLSCRKAGK